MTPDLLARMRSIRLAVAMREAAETRLAEQAAGYVPDEAPAPTDEIDPVAWPERGAACRHSSRGGIGCSQCIGVAVDRLPSDARGSDTGGWGHYSVLAKRARARRVTRELADERRDRCNARQRARYHAKRAAKGPA